MSASWLASQSVSVRQTFLNELSPLDALEFLYTWEVWARPEQLPPPGDWYVWLILAGRGFGKTRTGVEWIRSLVEGPTPHIAPPGAPQRIALVAETAADGRDVMVEGESGVLACSKPGFRPHYEPSKRRLTWPNGCQATLYSAEDPDQLRGPQHDLAWGDELAKWKYPDDTWSNLMFGLRLGRHPRVCVTTTPRPIPLLREIMKAPDVHITRGSTYDNRANLPEVFFNKVISKYEGTRLGRQELEAELLDDVAGALWNRDLIDATRVTRNQLPALKRVVVAVDPAVSYGEESNDTGIVVMAQGENDHGYVLEDLTINGSPDEWARRAVAAFYRNEADCIVAEVNNGGDLIEHAIRTVDQSVPVHSVRATRGKYVRAEPVAALYEQGRVHHVGGFPELEDQMCMFTPEGIVDGSPDRVDALVWAAFELFLSRSDAVYSDEIRL